MVMSLSMTASISGARVSARPAASALASRSQATVCHRAPEAVSRTRLVDGAKGVALALAVSASLAAPFVAEAIPQTSACATEACDGRDYSNKDLREEFYTKGSLKEANFSGSNLAGVSLFGANLTRANLSGANLTNADIGQANLTGANLSNAVLSGAIVSSTVFKDVIIDGADFSDTIVRKDINDYLCTRAKGTNQVTGEDTRDTLFCP